MDRQFQRAMQLYELGRHADAASVLREYLAPEPDDPVARTWLSFALTMNGDCDAAASEARAALGKDPTSPLAHHAHALALYTAAQTRVTRAIPLPGRTPDGLDLLHQSAAALKEAIRLDPTTPDHFALMARIWRQSGEWQRMLGAAEHGLSLDPTHVDCANIRGEALRLLGKDAESLRHLHATLELDPQDAFTHLNHAYSILYTGRHEEAVVAFAEALRLSPESPHARRGLLRALRWRNWALRQPYRLFAFLSADANSVIVLAKWAFALFFIIALAGVVLEFMSPPARGTLMQYYAIAVVVFPVVGGAPIGNYFLQWDRLAAGVLSRAERLTAVAVVAAGAALYGGALGIRLYQGSLATWIISACAAVVPLLMTLIVPPPRPAPLPTGGRSPATA